MFGYFFVEDVFGIVDDVAGCCHQWFIAALFGTWFLTRASPKGFALPTLAYLEVAFQEEIHLEYYNRCSLLVFGKSMQANRIKKKK